MGEWGATMKHSNCGYNALGALLAVIVAGVIVAILVESGDLVPWQLWAAITAAVTFSATLLITAWWWENWRKR